jgi:hypothetical protein
LIIITMVKKKTKGAARSDETGGFDDTRAGSGYNMEAQAVVLMLMRILAMWEIKEHHQQQQQQQQASLLGLLVVKIRCFWCYNGANESPKSVFGGQMYGMSGSGPPASRTRSVTVTATTNIPLGVAVGGVLTGGVASTGRAKVIEHFPRFYNGGIHGSAAVG